jgi:hypothetical protein
MAEPSRSSTNAIKLGLVGLWGWLGNPNRA